MYRVHYFTYLFTEDVAAVSMIGLAYLLLIHLQSVARSFSLLQFNQTKTSNPIPSHPIPWHAMPLHPSHLVAHPPNPHPPANLSAGSLCKLQHCGCQLWALAPE